MEKISLKEKNIMIKLENINKYYQSGSETVHALKNISLELPYQGLVFVLGQSGCGKSTLLNILGGLDKPSDGRVLIEGADFSKFSKSEHNNYLNSYLGFVFQEYNILKDLNLFDNIALPLEMQNKPRKEIKETTNKIIEMVGLQDLKKRKINQLSGGQRQRIAVARALIKNPKLIIADEPTGNLDSVTGETIFKLLKDLSKDRLILIVSHDEESAYKFGDRIINIEDGSIISDINKPFTEKDYNELLPNTIDENIEVVKVESKSSINSDYKTNNLLLTKVSAPIHTSIKLALKNINNKKFRFILMMLICALSLSFFSFTIELNDDVIRQNVYTSIDNEYLNAEILKKAEIPKEFKTNSIYDEYIGTSLESNEYEKVRSAVNDLNIHEYQNVAISIQKNANSRVANIFYTGEIEYITKFDDRNSYDLLFGRTPTNDNEILVTDYIIKMLEYFNYFDKEPSMTCYLGKYITLGSKIPYRICGIVNSNYEKYLKVLENTKLDYSDKTLYTYLNDYKTINNVYLTKDAYEIESNVLMDKINLIKNNIDITLISDLTNNHVSISDYTVTSRKVENKQVKKDENSYYIVGNKINHAECEVLLPYSLFAALFDRNVGEPTGYWNYYRTYEYIYNKNIKIEIALSDNTTTSIDAKVVGITNNNNNVIAFSTPAMEFIFDNGPKKSSSLLAEVSPYEKVAYEQFKNAYNNDYVIDLFAYREDIDSYEISPFISLLSKAGLFIFAVFTIGILWTIISLDIVDSKKEIGTFRSIGLSGAKVSLIFIIQTIFICFFSYIIALIVGNIAITFYNNTIYDNLNIIHLSMYMQTYRSFVFLLLFLLVITVLALFIPLYKIMSQKIINVINERQDM